jgi:ribonucleoside-triphosphate reductase
MKQLTSAKWIFVILSLLMVLIFGIISYFRFPEYRQLTLLFLYIIPSNSFVPFPHEPAIIYYGKLFGPLLTTTTAIVPTIIACIIDYAVLSPVFSRTRLAELKQSKIYIKTVYYYSKAPFWTNFIAAISPIPFYPVRILSVASEYPLWKYSFSVVLGRIPRYYFLALTGAMLNIPNWIILVFFFSLISIPLYKKLTDRKKKPALEIEDSLLVEEPIPTDDRKISSL